jgi:hypothetical protein
LAPLTHLIPVGIVLHLLDGVALSIEVNQLPSPLVYLFLRNRKNICYPAIYRRKITTLGGKTPWISELEFLNNRWWLGTA